MPSSREYCIIGFLIILVAMCSFLTITGSITSAASNVYNLTGQLQNKQAALNDPNSRNATVAKNTTDFLYFSEFNSFEGLIY
jgi:hypothetical protein